MKPDWSIFSKLDHNGGYLHKFPIDSPISHDIGLGLISQAGNLVECSFQHPRHICATGSGAVQEAFSCFNKFAGAFYFFFSRASNPKLFNKLSAVAGSSSRACRSHIKQVSSCLQHLPGLRFGSQLREEHAIQMLLARLTSATLGRLWNEVEEHHACNVLMLAATTVIPPFENISPKMLAESMALGKCGGHIREPVDQPYLDEIRPGCACVAVPRAIFPDDATEPITGIKFPTLLEDNSNLTAEVLVGMGFRSMRIMRLKNLNLYAFGLYIQPDSICKKLGPKYASIPDAELKDHPDFYEDLLRENIDMTVRLVVSYNGLSIGTVRELKSIICVFNVLSSAFEKSLCFRLQKMNPNTDYHCLKTFGSYFSEDIHIPAGTKIDFRQTSDGQLITEIDGKQIGTVRSKDLCKAFFDMYIGDPPISVETKQDIAQNVAGLIRRC
ncbi:fatty-acid-binding protein 2-like isoform X1 [Phragmites australis]|uniref:fatty-acid-binding protein 2-like isoform X1 n=1 Tax=Phragmites australis TaxID=29695 RepID=UPI002D79C096|nr:fatty-acid-binding protein 2-like isoform X1 [Phragmites australis]